LFNAIGYECLREVPSIFSFPPEQKPKLLPSASLSSFIMSGRGNSSLQQATGRGHTGQDPSQQGGRGGGGYYPPPNYQYGQPQQGGGLRPMPPGNPAMGWQPGSGESYFACFWFVYEMCSLFGRDVCTRCD
jgi:hypothetical protein